MVLFPTLAWQSSNRFHCIVCILEGSRHQLQVWTMLEKLVRLCSLHLSACVSEQLRERARDLLWACIVSVYPSVWVCVMPTLRQNDAFSSIGGPGSNPTSVETLSLSPQWENWSMCPTSHSLHEVKRFLRLISMRHGDTWVIWNSGQNRNRCLLQFSNSTGTKYFKHIHT